MTRGVGGEPAVFIEKGVAVSGLSVPIFFLIKKKGCPRLSLPRLGSVKKNKMFNESMGRYPLSPVILYKI